MKLNLSKEWFENHIPTEEGEIGAGTTPAQVTVSGPVQIILSGLCARAVISTALESLPSDEDRVSAIREIMCVECGDIKTSTEDCHCWNDE